MAVKKGSSGWEYRLWCLLLSCDFFCVFFRLRSHFTLCSFRFRFALRPVLFLPRASFSPSQTCGTVSLEVLFYFMISFILLFLFLRSSSRSEWSNDRYCQYNFCVLGARVLTVEARRGEAKRSGLYRPWWERSWSWIYVTLDDNWSVSLGGYYPTSIDFKERLCAVSSSRITSRLL